MDPDESLIGVPSALAGLGKPDASLLRQALQFRPGLR
jgi:hypothetical protein